MNIGKIESFYWVLSYGKCFLTSSSILVKPEQNAHLWTSTGFPGQGPEKRTSKETRTLCNPIYMYIIFLFSTLIDHHWSSGMFNLIHRNKKDVITPVEQAYIIKDNAYNLPSNGTRKCTRAVLNISTFIRHYYNVFTIEDCMCAFLFD